MRMKPVQNLFEIIADRQANPILAGLYLLAQYLLITWHEYIRLIRALEKS
jgi:hypothetical protein